MLVTETVALKWLPPTTTWIVCIVCWHWTFSRIAKAWTKKGTVDPSFWCVLSSVVWCLMSVVGRDFSPVPLFSSQAWNVHQHRSHEPSAGQQQLVSSAWILQMVRRRNRYVLVARVLVDDTRRLILPSSTFCGPVFQTCFQVSAMSVLFFESLLFSETTRQYRGHFGLFSGAFFRVLFCCMCGGQSGTHDQF